jgi:hypothetical protein
MKPYIAAAAVVALSSTLPQANAAMLVHQVATGIYRGPAPQTEADYQRLKQLGVRTVLNLRRIHRREIAYEGRRLAAMGIAHRHVPTAYRFPEASVPRALEILSDISLHPIYVHCQQGKDRTGLLVGLHRVQHQGWSSNSAYAEMTRLRFNPRLAGLRNHFWQNASSPAQLAGAAPPRRRPPASRQVASSANPAAALSAAQSATPRVPASATPLVSANRGPAITNPVGASKPGAAATSTGTTSFKSAAIAAEPVAAADQAR